MTRENTIISRHAVCARIRSLTEIKGGPSVAAEACGLKLATLETYLKGESLPGSVALAQLARGFGVTADFILFGPGRRDS